ncbi:MAG: hypothetical protein ACJAR8_000378 [Bacteroidia bacterium]|jgi:hypothetical protein
MRPKIRKYALLVFLFFGLTTRAQTNACDSVLMKDGVWHRVHKVKINQLKINYLGCDSNKMVLSSDFWIDVEKVILNHKKGRTVLSRDNIDALQSGNSIILKNRKHPKRIKIIKMGRKIAVVDSNKNKTKGRYYMLGTDTMLIKNTKVALQDIVVLKRTFKPTQYLGVVLVGLGYVALSDPWTAIVAPVAIPGFGLIFIRRDFNVKKKWEIVVI